MFLDSTIYIQGVGYTEVTIYLGKFMKKDEILLENMQDILFVNKKKTKDHKNKKTKKLNESRET